MTSRAVEILEVEHLADHLGGPVRDGAGSFTLAHRPLHLGLGDARVDRARPGHSPPDGAADDRERVGQRDEEPLERTEKEEGERSRPLGTAAREGPDDLGERAVEEDRAEHRHGKGEAADARRDAPRRRGASSRR